MSTAWKEFKLENETATSDVRREDFARRAVFGATNLIRHLKNKVRQRLDWRNSGGYIALDEPLIVVVENTSAYHPQDPSDTEGLVLV